MKFGNEDIASGNKHDTLKKDKGMQKKVSKKIGEYIDYEELKKK